MNAPFDVQNLLPAWEQYRAATDIAPIRDEAHYARMTEMLEALLDETRGDDNHPAMGLVDSVGDLFADYEAEHYSLPETTGVQALKLLMEQHGLKQSDLPEIGSQGVVSEIPAGKRELNIRMNAATKLLEAMRRNPLNWRIEQFQTVARQYGVSVRCEGW